MIKTVLLFLSTILVWASLLYVLTACTTTKKEPAIYICSAYSEPGIIAWGDTPQQAEEVMQLMNCDLKPGADCSNRKCDKIELL